MADLAVPVTYIVRYVTRLDLLHWGNREAPEPHEEGLYYGDLKGARKAARCVSDDDYVAFAVLTSDDAERCTVYMRGKAIGGNRDATAAD